MKKLFFLLGVFCAVNADAQNYLITFAGTGESTTVSTVKVDNLTKSTTLILNGADILRLNITTGIYSGENSRSPEMIIYPNPMTDNAIIQVRPPVSGDATVSLFDMAGKMSVSIQCYLDNSLQEFRLSGISGGFYLIGVRGYNYQYSGKLLCNGQVGGIATIEKLSNNQMADPKDYNATLKGVEAVVDMTYTKGDILRFTGISGNYTTILTDSPSSDKTITFDFVGCTDGDGNDYPIVVTGSDGGKCPRQVWMAANLKSTKYSDGTGIPHVADNIEWGSLNTPGYCWYNNDESQHKTVYGALYNWYTVNSGKLCPEGWHIPTDAEWLTLVNYYGGRDITGGKLKETGFTHWTIPNTGATNESGLTARPGGNRHLDGTFYSIGNIGRWWSSTELNNRDAWFWSLNYNKTSIEQGYYSKNDGFSVRCMKY